MRKDIIIDEVTGLEMAVVSEFNTSENSENWYVYLINKKDIDLDMVMVVSQGFSETKTTTVFRKKFEQIKANSSIKVELIHHDLFALDNRFLVSFFEGNKIYEKVFLFQRNTIKEGNLRMIPILNLRGVIVK